MATFHRNVYLLFNGKQKLTFTRNRGMSYWYLKKIPRQEKLLISYHEMPFHCREQVVLHDQVFSTC